MEKNIELGSEFNLPLNELHTVKDNLISYLKDYKVRWFDYGRSALRCIPVPDDKKVLLPEFICESVTKCFNKKNIQFYHVDEEFNIDIGNLLKKIDETVMGGGNLCSALFWISSEGVLFENNQRSRRQSRYCRNRRYYPKPFFKS